MTGRAPRPGRPSDAGPRPADAPGPVEVAFAEDEIDLSDQDATDAPVLIVFWVLAFVVFLQFFTRYVLNDSLGWTEEIARFLLIAVTFMGAIMAVRKQSHIAVEILYRYLPRPVRRVLQTAIDLGLVAFYALLALWSGELAGNTFQMMVSIDVPKAWLYWFVTACFALMALHQALATVRHLKRGTSRLIDPDADSRSAPLIE